MATGSMSGRSTSRGESKAKGIGPQFSGLTVQDTTAAVILKRGGCGRGVIGGQTLFVLTPSTPEDDRELWLPLIGRYAAVTDDLHRLISVWNRQYDNDMDLSFHPITDPMTFSQDIAGDYEFNQHWLGTYRLSEDYEWYEVRDGGEQVALLELDLKPRRSYWGDSAYPLPMDGPDVIEIQFIDVRLAHRGRGIGTAIVHWVAEQYPQRQMLALAEASDGFWQFLGWELIAPDESGYRPMYVSPL